MVGLDKEKKARKRSALPSNQRKDARPRALKSPRPNPQTPTTPSDLVVVARPQVDHDVLVAEEEEAGAGVVQLVHGREVRHLGVRVYGCMGGWG